MSVRRFALASFPALALSACSPSVTNTQELNQPSGVVSAAFDPTALVPVFPSPNDLELELAVPIPPPNAELEILAYFQSQGGFSYDQEVDLTIPFVAQSGSGTSVVQSAPALDLTSIQVCTAPSTSATSECNLLVFDATDGAYPTVGPISYAAGSTSGTLTVPKAVDPVTGNRFWKSRASGTTKYLFAVRGGPNGVKTTGGGTVNPSVTMYGLLFSPPSQLPPCLLGQAAECAQAQELQAAYQVLFAAVQNTGFPWQEIAVVGSFTIAPGSTWVQADPSATFPLPSDFLIDPTTGNVNAELDALFGGLPVSTLDGFSTTALETATTSGPIQALTVRNNANPASPAGVFLYELVPASGGATTASYVQVHDVVDWEASDFTESPTIVTQPPELSSGTPPLAALVALQPAVPVALGPVSPTAPGTLPPGQLSLPPLKEGTTYAVVVTKGILDASGAPLSNTTLGQMLMFQNPLCEPSPLCAASPTTATATIPGVPGAEASGLEKMRLALQPLFPQVQSDHGVAKSDIAMVYTFTTQTFLTTLAELAGIPYEGGGTAIVPGTPVSLTPAQAFAVYGVDPVVVPGVTVLATASGTIDPVLLEVLEVPFPTVNLVDPTTGAFYPNPSQAQPAVLQALLAVPDPTKVTLPSCPSGSPVPYCAPLVVFHHGLGGGSGQMLLAANELAAQGFVVAAIDAPLHGLRSYCQTNAQCVTASGGQGTCTPIGPPGTQGDESPPGLCSGGSVLLEAPVLCATPECQETWASFSPVSSNPAEQQAGVAVASGNYLFSTNVFRSRDNLRQDVIDVSALILALARPPAPLLPAVNPTALALHLASENIAIDPGHVYYEGVSLGAILGTLNVAANPRISEAVLDSDGGTIVDVVTNAPALADLVGPLLPPPGTQAYLETLLAFKWILDPADPVNLAAYVEDGLPSPIGSQPAPKSVLGLWAACDNTVPNPYNVEVYDNIGLRALTSSTSTSVLYERGPGTVDANHPACPLGTSEVPHGFMLSWGLSASGQDATDAALTLLAQDQAAAFLANPQNLPAPVQVKP